MMCMCIYKGVGLNFYMELCLWRRGVNIVVYVCLYGGKCCYRRGLFVKLNVVLYVCLW